MLSRIRQLIAWFKAKERSLLDRHVRQIIRRGVIGYEWEVITWSGKKLTQGHTWTRGAAEQQADHWATVYSFQINRGEIRERPCAA